MTLIQPHQPKNIFFIAVGALFLLLFTGALWLILLYNQTVNFRHGISAATARVQTLQTENADVKDQLLSFLNGSDTGAFATERNLVQEKNPHYLRASQDQQWVFASRF